MMAENGTVWKSDYPRRHIYFLGTLGLLLGLGIIVLEATMVVYRDDIRLNDIRNNPLLPIAITGLTFGVYFIILAIVTACAAKAKSRCITITFLVMSLIALALDLCLLSFHGLHLITRCNPNEFEGLGGNFGIRNCRNEFDHVLLINRHGTSLLLIIIGITLHAVVNFCSILVSFYVVCHFEQVQKEVSSRVMSSIINNVDFL
ncbi:uncharacterized protein LOC130701364 isoform X1 [Daphnia carinata]|uniref:uncharacterized protein LOC130701364 isoform X1 n=2 Tax=Daphnia carinata TaxID=120202 RepID=UPI00258119BE|nr:uncharacterized protein LOC130701364 isoform X1 [Daphnia carinata]